MNDDYLLRSQMGRPRSSARPLIGAVALSFLLGAAVMGWIGWENGMNLPGIGSKTPETVQPAETSPLAAISPTPSPANLVDAGQQTTQAVEQAVERVEQFTRQTGGMEQRIAALEQRVASLDLRTQASSGNAARAEGLLIAFAARRRIERGDKLGSLEEQLRLRFGAAQPQAVDAVIALSERPVTLDQLISRLETMGPRLASPPISEQGLGWFTRELGELFIIRRETTASPQPQRRLSRARVFLQSGRIDEAVAEVRYLPGADRAGDWVADANRYGAAQRALDVLEYTAVLEPRELRDAEGNKVEQPGPTE